MASTSTMSARSSRDSTKKPTLVARISAAAIPAASLNKSAPRAPVATTVPSPASAGQRRACSVGPVRVNSAAESQYMSGGLVRNGSPFMRGVTQSPVTTISRAGSANIPSVSEKPGRPSRQKKSGDTTTTTASSRRVMLRSRRPPRAGT